MGDPPRLGTKWGSRGRRGDVGGLPLIVAVLVALLATTAPARAGTPEDNLHYWTNRARAQDGAAPLNHGWRLRREAELHARRLANAGRIYHGGLERFEGRRCVGQNVGVSTSVWKVFDAFMRSAAHRSNILHRCFRYLGSGVVYRDGLYWVVMNFASPPRS